MNTTNLSRNEESNVTDEEATMTDFINRLRKLFNNAEMDRILKSIGIKDRKVKKYNFLNNSTDKIFDLPDNSPDRRHSLELKMQVKDSQSLCHDIMVDFRFGNPTWEQFIDVTYEVGSGYDIKIIIFENDNSKKGYYRAPCDEFVIFDLVDINNKCGVKTYLLEASGLIKYLFKGEKRRIKYSLMNGPYDSGGDLYKVQLPQQLPTKKEVQISEFWLGYYLSHLGEEKSLIDHEVIVNWTPGYLLYHNLETKAYWNDDGFFIDLLGDASSHVIQWIWENKKSLFEEAYPGCPITLKTEDGQTKSLSVRVFDLSLAELLEMEPSGKWIYGEMTYVENNRFSDIAGDIIDDYISMHKSTQVTATS